MSSKTEVHLKISMGGPCLLFFFEALALARWWFQIFFEFSPRSLGKMNQFFVIFFNWVVQPPTSKHKIPCCLG